MSAHMIIAPGWQELLHDCRLDSFAAVDALESGEIVARKKSSEVRRMDLYAGDRRAVVYIKKYRLTQPSQLASALIRDTWWNRARAAREYENLMQLRKLGLDAPEPVAYGENRCLGFLTRSFLISRAIESAVPLDRFLQSRPTQKQRRELIERLADNLRRLHDRRFEHHDLYWRNIILSGDNLTHFYLLDAHKGGIWKTGREHKARAQDLATLDAPAPAFFRRTERLRFFLRYVGRNHLTLADKELARLVLRMAEPMRAAQARRARKALAPSPLP